jgi:predicted ATP-dependent endonuclease of OLD family
MRISRIQIYYFRNFHELNIALREHAVIVGENKLASPICFSLWPYFEFR